MDKTSRTPDRLGDFFAFAVGSSRKYSAVMPLKKMQLVVAGAATAVAVQVGRWFRRSARLFGFAKV